MKSQWPIIKSVPCFWSKRRYLCGICRCREVGGRVDGGRDGLMEASVGGLMEVWVDGLIEVWVDGLTEVWIGGWVTECIRINWCIVDHITWVYQSISVSLSCLTKVQIIPSWTNIPHSVSLARLNTAAVLHWPRGQLNSQLTKERESIPV